MICFRPSPHVLVSQSLPTEDFFYVCESHFSDRHFATKIAVTPATGTGSGTSDASRLPDKVTQAEIDKIKKEYEERQKKKDEAKAKKEAEEKDKDKKEDKDKKDEKGSSWFSGLSSLLTDSVSASSDSKTADSSKAAASSGSASPTTTAAPVAGQHERYQLHRDFFNMRLDAWKKREAVKKAKELNLPMAPKGELRGA